MGGLTDVCRHPCGTLSDMATRDVQRSFRLPDDLDQQLVAKAEKLDRSVSWVIVRALELALYGEEKALTQAVIRGAVQSRRKRQ